MKKYLFITLQLFITGTILAQTTGQKTLQKAKDQTNNRIDQKTDELISDGLDRIESGIKGIFKGKKKNASSTESPEQQLPNSGSQSSSNNATSNNSNGNKISSNSKFDFVAGTKVLQFDDFARVNIGDFPADYNSNTTGEVVTIDGKEGKWLNLSKNGCLVPDYTAKLPENFTLEFEVGINADPSNNLSGLGLNFSTKKDELMKEMFFKSGNAVIYLHPGAANADVFINPTNGATIENTISMPQWDVRDGANKNFAKISVWRQKGRIRVYVNEDKVVDVPRFFVEDNTYSFGMFRNFFYDCNVYLANIRFAIAGEDLRTKLLNEGKFSTTGITFDVNSDKIKQESKATLDEIANLLQQNNDIKLRIVGHTDSDGDAQANLALSTQRAEAIKKSLVNNYAIDANRLITIGKGENEPLNNNQTAADKAANRRVEFIKF
jgi:OmpA-OmpF porin, OOP family